MPARKSILFVDDEPRILSGLRRMLHALRQEWDMSFAEGGPAALEALGRATFDVIVSDMRMPGMQGVELLEEVRKRYPHMVRIALSGQASRETVLRSVGLVHQYLAKPCEAETLRATLTGACSLAGLVVDAELRDRLASLASLPSMPEAYERLAEQLSADSVSVSEVGRIVARDVSLTARVMQLVSSAFFARPARVSGPAYATVFLGLDILKALASSPQAFRRFDEGVIGRLPIESLWSHSRAVAEAARQIVAADSSDALLVEQVYAAGMLHDVGKVALAAELPGEYEAAIRMAQTGTPLRQAEQAILGTDHTKVGAYLMGLWGLPETVLQAVAFHHNPGSCQAKGAAAAPLAAVHVANVVARRMASPDGWGPVGGLDQAYLGGAGLIERLPAWEEIIRNTLCKETANV